MYKVYLWDGALQEDFFCGEYASVEEAKAAYPSVPGDTGVAGFESTQLSIEDTEGRTISTFGAWCAGWVDV